MGKQRQAEWGCKGWGFSKTEAEELRKELVQEDPFFLKNPSLFPCINFSFFFFKCRVSDPWSWNHSLRGQMWVLGTEFVSSGRAPSIPSL